MRRHLQDEMLLRLQWVLSVFVGYTLAPPLTLFISLIVAGSQTDFPLVFTAVTGIISGVLIGFLQWYLLRHRLSRANNWFAGSVVGFSLAQLVSHLSLFYPFGVFGAGLVFGGIIGITQSIVIGLQASKFWRWLIANAFGWALGNSIGVFLGGVIGKFWGTPIVGILVGLITGQALIGILKSQDQL